MDLWACFAVVAGLLHVSAAEAAPLVALMLSGQARSLPRTLCSIRTFIVDVLKKQGYMVHLFAIVEKDGHEHKVEPIIRRQHLLGSSQRHVTVVQRPRTPLPCWLSLIQVLTPRQVQDYGCQYAGEVLSQLYYRELVYNTTLDYERAHGVRFEWLLMGRFDTVFANPLPRLWDLLADHVYIPNWELWGGLNDRFAILGHKVAGAYATLYSSLCLGPNASHPAMAWALPALINVERLYKWHLDRMAVLMAPLNNFYFGRLRLGESTPRDLGVMGVTSCVSALRAVCFYQPVDNEMKVCRVAAIKYRRIIQSYLASNVSFARIYASVPTNLRPTAATKMPTVRDSFVRQCVIHLRSAMARAMSPPVARIAQPVATQAVPAGPRTRVAVLLYGRAQAISQTICSLKFKLIAPLKAQGHQIHLFATVERGANESIGRAAAFRRWKVLPRDQLHIAYITAPPPGSHRSRCDPASMGSNGDHTDMTPELFHREVTYNATVIYQQAHGFRFDWLVCASLDTLFVRPIPALHPLHPSQLHTSHHFTSDGRKSTTLQTDGQIAVGRLDIMRCYCRLYTTTKMCDPSTAYSSSPAGEGLNGQLAARAPLPGVYLRVKDNADLAAGLRALNATLCAEALRVTCFPPDSRLCIHT